MNANDFKALCVPPTLTVHDALAALDASGRGVLMVVGDEGSLQRTVTDGDLRRAALAQADFSSPLSTLPTTPALTLPATSTPAQALALMDQHQIDHLPIVDTQGRPVDLVLRRELTSASGYPPPTSETRKPLSLKTPSRPIGSRLWARTWMASRPSWPRTWAQDMARL